MATILEPSQQSAYKPGIGYLSLIANEFPGKGGLR